MIHLRLNADSLAATHFVISPLKQAAAVLHPGQPEAASHTYFTGHDVTETLQERRLRLLSALRREIGGYAPDFVIAGTAAGHAPDLEAELHNVATSPAPVITRELERVLHGLSRPGHWDRPGSSGQPALREFVDLGERAFAQRAACELEQFWKARLAPVWSSLLARAEADIEHRTRAIARVGLNNALNSLHPMITYCDGTLSLAGECEADLSHQGEEAGLSLFPSALTARWLLCIDPWNERGARLIYPAAPLGSRPGGPGWPGVPGGPGAPGGDRAGQPLEAVIGHSRLALLNCLSEPRTTTDLAERHYMSPSTVSYHLSRLHRVGLVTRTREGNRVYYQRASKAQQLLDTSCGPGPEASRRQGGPVRPRRRPVTSITSAASVASVASVASARGIVSS
ncbi:ArsR/SmtB family transcription factor [Streptomyces sp. NPDC054841]